MIATLTRYVFVQPRVGRGWRNGYVARVVGESDGTVTVEVPVRDCRGEWQRRTFRPVSMRDATDAEAAECRRKFGAT